MIVKNESHIIKDTLEKLCQKINFSYWVICDTGSTDNTKEIIRLFFASKNIPGELHENKWLNFADNRTLALQYAYKKTDLLLVFDADDEIVGDIQMPKVGDIKFDEYHLKFGSHIGTSYTRVLLINNNKKFVYKSVIHEYICCIESQTNTNTVIEGNYYVVSGRSGNRNKDPDKYLKDAKILEEAHAEALIKNDPLYRRYAFYCANSYKDYGLFEEAIKWYKITLGQDNWEQEKYVSCLNIYECYEKINQKETGFFYLVKAFNYDPERVECLYPLLVHYCCEGQNHVAYNYYLMVKDYYENYYLTTKMDKKLFITLDKYNFFLPYYIILIADKVQDFECVIKMFEIIFIKKMPMGELWYIRNLLYNLQFFIQHLKIENKDRFISLTNDYFNFLYDLGIPLNTIEFLKNYDTRFGIDVSYIFQKTIGEKKTVFSKEECKSSKNILFYTGFSDIEWNYSYLNNNALGGSEKAVAYLSKCFPKEYNIYVSGAVKNETIENVSYIHLDQLTNLIKTTAFHTVVISRYISFYEMFQECSFYQSFIWAHDTQLLPYGCHLNENQILTKWDKYIDGCICLTEWHRNIFIEKYSELSNKITLINNGLDLDSFTKINKSIKQTNKFIYSSRPERGLDILLQLWPQILDLIPDAVLVISNYGVDPNPSLMDIIKKYNSILYLGKLNTEQLYTEISTAEYWLYPTHWPETSCITALEMLMSEVICLYYPVAGLPYTIDKYGIQIESGNEIDTILNLTIKNKINLKKNGKKYAESCSWSNRAKEWSNVLSLSKEEKEEVVIDQKIIDSIQYLHDNLSIPKDHVEYLKKLCNDEHFSPNIIYDIGSNVLHWTKEARIIWPNAKIIAFDAIKTAEFLYKEYNLQYFIGVLSDSDNKTVNFYENMEMPGGNSYYKEIGHSNAENMFPETKYTKSKTITLSSAVKKNGYPFPDLIKIDVQGSELDIIKGSLDVINRAKYLIVELQHEQYNRGAPLADTTIQFLEQNDWELVANKFCNNGVDADYCFKNKKINKKKKEKVIFILPDWYNPTPLEDYFDSLKNIFDLSIIIKEDELTNFNIDRAIFVCIVHNLKIYDILKEHNINVSILNTEPLNMVFRLNNFKQHIPNELNYSAHIYDYSLSNLKILNNNGYMNTEHLPYKIYESENTKLTNLYKNTFKEYDFGIISYENPIILEKRKNIVDFLLDNNYKVNIIHGWKDERDKEVAKCFVILNIHGQAGDYESQIFEHIRCDRLLSAGFKILSESSLYLDETFIKENSNNLKIINYNDFFNADIYKNLNWLTKNQTHPIKIIDCFTFYNEINMLTYRLNALNNVVDYFILVEAKQTHVGNSKPLFYNENKHLFEKFSNKIIHIIVDLPFNKDKINISNDDQWTNEIFQRNCISQGIDILKNQNQLNDNDYIIIADVDEIPDPQILLKLRDGLFISDIIILEQDFYYYNLNSKRNEYWYHSKMVSYKKYKDLNISFNDIRFLNGIIVKNGGWHLSFFGDAQFIKNKLENFAHQEYNSDTFTDTAKISQKINEGLDLFNRDKCNKSSSIQKITIDDNSYLPPIYDKYLKAFYSKPSKPKIYCVIHSCTIPNKGTKVLDFIVNIINKTGFIDIVDNIIINNIGIPIENIYNDNNEANNKYTVINYAEDTSLYEYPSLNKIKEVAAQDPNSYILYLHTKGITRDGQILNNVKDWINMMLYFLVEKYDECINQLNNNYDTVGCNYHLATHYCPVHYSGNFWWSKSSYINKLHLLDETNVDKAYAEFWLFTSNPNYYTIHSSSNVDHYYDSYPMEIYSHNSIIQQIINN
jgi:beta-1,4-mannosyl-glycoprotein beta-1,4-N-acetylglucosaminyltransferase